MHFLNVDFVAYCQKRLVCQIFKTTKTRLFIFKHPVDNTEWWSSTTENRSMRNLYTLRHAQSEWPVTRSQPRTYITYICTAKSSTSTHSFLHSSARRVFVAMGTITNNTHTIKRRKCITPLSPPSPILYISLFRSTIKFIRLLPLYRNEAQI